MAAKVKVQFKHKKGVLHIGGGRFFHPGELVDVTASERDELLEAYPADLEEVKGKTKASNTADTKKEEVNTSEEGK